MIEAKDLLMLGGAPWLNRPDYPKLVGGLEAWFDETDPDSMIYDSSNRVALISDKSGNSGSGSGRSSGLYLRGASGQYASAPDISFATTQLEVAALITSANYTYGTAQIIAAKHASTSQRSFYFGISASTGTLFAGISSDGTSITNAVSSIALSTTNGSAVWVKFTWVSATGIVQFFTSPDGVTWTQLGANVTGIQLGNSIFDSTSVIEAGAYILGTSFNFLGSIGRVIIRSTVNGTAIFDANFVGQRTNATSFTESSSNAATVTINGTALLGWVDSANVLCLNGVAGNYASAPDSVPLSITTSIDLRTDVMFATYASVGNQNLISKTQTDGQSAYDCYIVAAGSSVVFRYTPNGTFASLRTATSTATLASVAAVFTRVQIRITYNSATGDVIFYYRTDGDLSANTGWTQLGATVSLTSGTIFDGTNVLTVGGWTGGNATPTGNIFRAQIYNGIAGTLAFDANFATCPKLAGSFIESSSNAAVVTINTSGASGARVSGARDRYQGTAASQQVFLPWSGTNYGYINGVVGSYFSTPDANALDITGDIDLRAYIAMTDWTPSSAQVVIGKYDNAGTQRSYQLFVNTSGTLTLNVTVDGAAQLSWTSSVAPSVADLAAKWIRATRVSSTGVGNFYTSDDGVSWSQLGTANIAGTSGSIWSGTASLQIGAQSPSGASPFTGNIYRVQIYNGIAGTLAFDFNPAAYASGTTFLDSSANAATITINAGAMIVTRSGLYSDGSDDYSKTPGFGFAQPCSVTITGAHMSWVGNDAIYDGGSGFMALLQSGSSPSVANYALTVGTVNSEWPLHTGAFVSSLFNAAVSSALQINRGTPVGGNVGSGTANGFTVGGINSATQFACSFLSEELLFSKNLTISERARLALWSARKHRLPAV